MNCDYNHIGTGVACDGHAAFTVTFHKSTKHVCEPMAQRIWTQLAGGCICRAARHTHWVIEPMKEAA